MNIPFAAVSEMNAAAIPGFEACTVHVSHLAQTAKCTIWVISHAQLPVTRSYRDIGLIFGGAGEQSFIFIC